MGPKLTEEELLSPTKYKVDHGTMTLHPEKSIPTMQITLAGTPPVFLRGGIFYSQDGSEYDMDRFPGGEEGLRKHLADTANTDILALHGFNVPGRNVNGQKRQVDEDGVGTPELPKGMPKAFAPVDMSSDPSQVLDIIGDGEMDMESIAKVAGIAIGRVRMALEDLGGQVERVGEGRKGSPFLFRKVEPA